MISSWREFWDRPHRIYVNDRHRAVHYERIAADIVSEIPSADATVLDFGCGEALRADKVAAACGKLYLCESAPTLRVALAARYAGNPKVAAIAPEEIDGFRDGSLDLVVANSVLQYLPRAECADLVRRLRTKLSPRGRMILADVIPPDAGLTADVSSLMRTAAREGFLLAALSGLASTLVSDYRRLRQRIGLTAYSETEILSLLEQAGYAARRRPGNFGFNQGRMAIVAEPR